MSFVTKQAEADLGIDLDGDGIIGSGREFHTQGQAGLGGNMMNQMERMTGVDLNGDGRIAGGFGHPQPSNQFGGQRVAYYSTVSTYQSGTQSGGQGFPPNSLHTAGNTLNQMENMTGMDLNGDGRIGGSGQGCTFNQYAHHF